MAKFKNNSKTKNRKGTPVGKAKFNQKNKVVSKIKKKAIANRTVGDARNVLHAKSRKLMLATGKESEIFIFLSSKTMAVSHRNGVKLYSVEQ